MKPSRDIARLIEIMAALRTPNTGCPWDLEQDFSTIAPYTIEEAYEVADAIERGDMDDLKHELGDLLLQSIYHARLAEEAGHFDFGDVVESITNKMIRRHPHVFGDSEARSRGADEGQWNRIKTQEKAERKARRETNGIVDESEAQKSALDEVPLAFPGLTAAKHLLSRAERVGIETNERLDGAGASVPGTSVPGTSVFGEIRNSLDSLEAETKERQAERFGDFLFAAVGLSRSLGIDPEAAIRSANARFRKRFRKAEAEAKASRKA